MKLWQAVAFSLGCISTGVTFIVQSCRLATWTRHDVWGKRGLGGLLFLFGFVFLACWFFRELWGRTLRRQLDKQLSPLQAELDHTRGRLAEAERKLSVTDADDVRKAVDRASGLWTSRLERHQFPRNYEDDPVYSQISLDAEIASILAQPILQRLNYVRQLSFAYLTFRSATHTRLAHSLGASRNAVMAMGKVFQENLLYTRDYEKPIAIPLHLEERARLVKLAKIAALLHD